jgi:ribosome-binding protein aMBF1 (putative translation factor)
MRFDGKIYKDGNFWLAEVPILEAMTQGHTRKEALEMVADFIETLANKPGFKVDVIPRKKDGFEVGSSDTKTLVSLLLKRQREQSGLSLSDASKRLGAKSRNAYARYERGDCMPTLEKLIQLFQAVSPGKDIVLNQSS